MLYKYGRQVVTYLVAFTSKVNVCVVKILHAKIRDEL